MFYRGKRLSGRDPGIITDSPTKGQQSGGDGAIMVVIVDLPGLPVEAIRRILGTKWEAGEALEVTSDPPGPAGVPFL